MKLIEIDWNPTDRQLRQFGGICLVGLPGIGWIWGADTYLLGLLAACGLTLGTAGVVVPKLVKPIFLVLTLVATPIGIVIGELAMLLIYFGVFLPLGVVFRMVGRDVLRMTVNRDAKTYWQTKSKPKSVASYYRQS